MKIKVSVDISEPQSKFLLSDKKFTAFVGGRGSGKTFILGHRASSRAANGRNQLIVGRTYKELRQTIIPSVTNALEIYRVPFTQNKNDNILTLKKSKVLFLSGENPEAIRSYTDYHDGYIDEAAWQKPMVMKNLSMCLRGKDVLNPSVSFTTTPRGGSWFNLFVMKSNQEKLDLIKCTTFDNPFLSEDSLELFKEALSGDEKLARQELYADLLSESPINAVIPDNLIFMSDVPSDLPVSIGIDVAREGVDNTFIVVSNEKGVVESNKFSNLDGINLYLNFEKIAKKYRTLCSVSVDNTGGWASSFLDIVKTTDYRDKVFGINFASSASNNIYANKRAEMLFKLRDLCGKKAFSLKNCQDVVSEINATTYFLNSSGQRQIIDKKLIKKDIGHSPDELDAVSLSVLNGFNLHTNKARYSPLPQQGW